MRIIAYFVYSLACATITPFHCPRYYRGDLMAQPTDTKTTGKTDTISIIDNRTGKRYELPIENDTIKAIDLRQIKVKDDDFGMMTYDPAFMNTAACKSTITFIDGDKGILRYRGYPIEQ